MKLVLVAFELDVAVWCYRRRHHHCYCYRRHRRLHVLVVVELCLDCEHLLASSKRNISVVIPPVSAAGCAWMCQDVPMSRVCRREAAVAAVVVVVVGEYCADCCYCVFDCI